MRGLARFIATSTLVIGSLGAFILAIAALTSFPDGGMGNALVLVGWAFGVFLSAGASACVLSLLASIDERLQAAGHEIPSDPKAEDGWMIEEEFRAPGVKAGADDDLDEDLESKLNFQRTHGRG